MPLQIVRSGVLDNIQDNGRYGYSEFGINPSGAMDRFAARLANSLVGNPADKAVIEMHFPGPHAVFTEDALISITGADFSITINDEPLPRWHPVLVKKASVLQCHSLKKGARAYLAVHGGFFMDKWLDSFSTHLKGNAGGWKGRKLEKGDEIPFGYHEVDFRKLMQPGRNFRTLPWSPDTHTVYFPENEISFVPGREWALLDERSLNVMAEETFTISKQSDRMGYQLNSSPLSLNKSLELITTPVGFGTMQLLPGGQLIILMADHQTTGGYPRVGHVISAHLPRLAQLNAGDNIHFHQVDQLRAETELINQLKEMDNLHALCNSHLNNLLCAK